MTYSSAAWNPLLLLVYLSLATEVLSEAGDEVVFVNADPPPGSTEIAVRRFDVHQKCALFAMKTEECEFGTVQPAADGGFDCKCFKLPEHDYLEVAQGKPCSSSSIYDSNIRCDKLLDGSLSTSWDSGSCFHTGDERNPWWQVDLQGVYTISHVIILTRSDCCTGRFNPINIFVGMSAEEKESGNICQQGIMNTGIYKRQFDCVRPRKGRFVFIQRQIESGFLQMCEVQVYRL